MVGTWQGRQALQLVGRGLVTVGLLVIGSSFFFL